MLAIAAQGLSPEETRQMTLDFLGPERVSNRLDCLSHSSPETEQPSPAVADEVDSIFLFPMRPHLLSEEARRPVRYVSTFRDGRSFLREGRVRAIVWERWPRFSARIDLGYGTVELDSDPNTPGKITLRGRYRTSHGPDERERGECRFVPDVPTNERASR
jgi:hypothetical protein